MKIQILKECEMPAERLLHPGEGCSCSVMDAQWFYPGEILEDFGARAGKRKGHASPHAP